MLLCLMQAALLYNKFSITNGVKQGGVLLPVLFTVYIDELLYKLQQAGLGCHIGHLFAGAFGYANDATLLSPAKYALLKMLNIA